MFAWRSSKDTPTSKEIWNIKTIQLNIQNSSGFGRAEIIISPRNKQNKTNIMNKRIIQTNKHNEKDKHG